MKANLLSLSFKILGACILVAALLLKGFRIWDLHIQEVISCALALQALVLPIDISKIKEAKDGK